MRLVEVGRSGANYPSIANRIITPGDVGKANITADLVGKRPTGLFTGQWADRPMTELTKEAAAMGFHTVNPCTWGDHYNVDIGATSTAYHDDHMQKWTDAGLLLPTAIETHLVSQLLTENPKMLEVDSERWQQILPKEIWGDGTNPAQIKVRAKEHTKNAIRAAANAKLPVVVGFMGSPIWHLIYKFPPTDIGQPDGSTLDLIERGFDKAVEDMADILKVCAEKGVYYAVEVHPTELCFDNETTMRFIEKLEEKYPSLAPWFGINFDPSHFLKQGIDPVAALKAFPPQIVKHIHVKGSVNHLASYNGVVRTIDGNLRSNLNGHLDFGHTRRASDFAETGEDHIRWTGPNSFFQALDELQFPGVNEIEHEAATRDRVDSVTRAARFVTNSQRKLGFGFEKQFKG